MLRTIGRAVTAALAAAALVAAAAPALAHVTLDQGEAAAGSYYKGVLRVPHGCAGAATLKVRVRIPEGVVAVKPMPKPGWELQTVKGAYKAPYDLHGRSLTEGVQEIVWTGKLLDENYDEFVFQGRLTERLQAGTTVYFPTVQECEDGRAERWIEIPDGGKSAHEYQHPAPAVRLTTPKPRH
jgi:uncharacterized protein YcnI